MDLKLMANGKAISPSFRKVIAEYMELADHYRAETEKVIQTLSPILLPRYMLSLHIIFNLYLQVFERIDVGRGNFTAEELNPTIDEVKARVEQVVNDFQK